MVFPVVPYSPHRHAQIRRKMYLHERKKQQLCSRIPVNHSKHSYWKPSVKVDRVSPCHGSFHSAACKFMQAIVIQNRAEDSKLCRLRDGGQSSTCTTFDTHTTDLGGLLKGVSEKVQLTTSKGMQSSKVELDIESISGYNVNLAIWPDKQHLLDVESIQKHEGPVPIVVTSTTVSAFRGVYSYSTSKASKIYLGIQIPEISSLLNTERQSMDQSVVMHLSQGSSNGTQLETVHTNLEQLLVDVIGLTCRGKVYVVNATVLAIDTQTPWHYLSCPVCKSGVTKTDEGFNSRRCNADNFNPIQRFRVGMQIFGQFKSTEITLFDKQAEAFIGRTMSEMKLIQKLDKGNDKIKQILTILHGMDATFEFRPSNKDILNKGLRMAPTKVTKQQQFTNDFDNEIDMGNRDIDENITENGDKGLEEIVAFGTYPTIHRNMRTITQKGRSL